MTTFGLVTKNCRPTVYNYVSLNNDNKNDVFFIDGLRDVFVNFKLSVYNRWGTLIWTGDNNAPDWDGFATKGLRIGNESVPAGTYYYALELNDPDYPKPMIGFVYLTRS
jgi:gliding motility-associated-like protein